jgi:hypothetical protein
MMRLLRTLSIIVRMVLESMMRREAARFALASMAQAVAPGPLPRWRHETRRDHFRNGVAGLLEVGSEVAWRPGPLAIFLATRERVQAELRYALAELRRAVAPTDNANWRSQRLLLVGVPAAAAALGVLVARSKMGSGPAEPAPE